MDVRKWGDAQTSFERRPARDEDAPGIAVRVVVTVLAPSGVLALLEAFARSDRPSRFSEGDHRRDTIVVAKVQPLRKFFFPIYLNVRHALKLRDQSGVIVAAVDHQHR